MSESHDAHADEFNTLHIRTTERVRILEALALDAADEGLESTELVDLPPHGRWFHGEEDPTIRRYLVSPPGRLFTRVLPSATDWTHEWVPGLIARLGCQAAYLMLHDADVFTLHLYEGDQLACEYNSSPPYFDVPSRPEGELGLDLERALEFCVPGTTAEALRKALAPKGQVDIDGLTALRQTARLLGLEQGVETTYGLSLETDGRSPKRRLAEDVHVAFQLGEGDEAPRGSDEQNFETAGSDPSEPEREDDDRDESSEGAQVLPFRKRDS